MKKIKLTQGRFAKVDDEDFEYLNQFKWQTLKIRKNIYALRSVYIEKGKTKSFLMHREILFAKKGTIIDHKDGNGLNNQKINLRFCTAAENCWNRKSMIPHTTKFQRISICNIKRKYKNKIYIYKYFEVNIYANGRRICKRFKDKNIAIIESNKLANKYHKQFAVIHHHKQLSAK